MIPEKLKNIALEIEAAEKVRQNNQSAILAYCRDKSFPLKERFTYWSKYCDKKNSSWILHKKDVKSSLLGYIIEKANEYSERREEIGYDRLLDICSDLEIEDLERMLEIKREIIIDSILEEKTLDFSENSKDWKYIVSKLDTKLKEAILDENFGSYNLDW